MPYLNMWFFSCGKHFYATLLEGVEKKGGADSNLQLYFMMSLGWNNL